MRAAPLALLLGALCAAAACTSPESAAPQATSSPSPITGGTLRVLLPADVTTLDPANADDASLMVTRQIFEGLVAFDAKSFAITPALATSWRVASDGTQWTFTLRDSVVFHDGAPFDAAAVVANIERVRSARDPARGPWPYLAYGRLFGGFDEQSLISRVEALDTRTVRLTTRTPFGPLLAHLAAPAMALVSPRSITANPVGFGGPGTRSLAGTGPFAFHPGAWQRDGVITLQRWPQHWARDPQGGPLPYLDAVTFRSVTTGTVRLSELRAGRADVALDVVIGLLPVARADPNLVTLPRRDASVAFLGLDLLAPPLDRVEARRAIAMAIDRRVGTATVYAGTARPAAQFASPGLLGYDGNVVAFAPFDVSAAKRSLADAGYGGGFEADLFYPTEASAALPDPQGAAVALAADLAKIRVVVTPRPMEPRALAAAAAANRLPLWLGSTDLSAGDADDVFWPSFAPTAATDGDGPSSGSGWVNTAAWGLLRRARSEVDDGKRTELYKQVSKIIRGDVPRIPLFYVDRSIAATKRVERYAPHSSGTESFATVLLRP